MLDTVTKTSVAALNSQPNYIQTADGVSLFYRDWGSGKPLLFLSGWTPSRDMLLHLAERLEVPLRERNAMLLAAGYAPVYAERSLEDPAMAAARQAIELVLKGHEPYPALAVDRHWNLVAANAALAPMLAGVADRALLEPPVNVLRLSLHPEGMRRASPIWRNGERICLIGYAVRS